MSSSLLRVIDLWPMNSSPNFCITVSPIQPNYVPINCSFEVHDAEDTWDFGRSFDYIHGRALLSCFTDPKSIIQKAFDTLEPGGHLELQDGTRVRSNGQYHLSMEWLWYPVVTQDYLYQC